jgi:hypothetical protein
VLSVQINHLVKPFLFRVCMSLFPTLAEYFMYSHFPMLTVLTIGRKFRVDWMLLRTYSLQNYFSKL